VKAFRGRSGPSGSVLVDITRDDRQGRCEVDWTCEPQLFEAEDERCRGRRRLIGEATLRLIKTAERPLISGGTRPSCCTNAEARRCWRGRAAPSFDPPSPLLGIGGVAALPHTPEPRHDGHDGEAWGNKRDSGSDM